MKVFLRSVLSLCLLAVALGGVQAQDDVGEYMRKGQQAFDRGDIVDAMQWFRKAAEKDHIPGQIRLAQHLDYSEQNEEAAEWYRKAADQGSIEAQHQLGMMYAVGEGVAKDPDEALRLLTRAADQNYVQAIRTLALAYADGQLGLTRDPEAALSWLQRGVAQKDQWSIERLAQAYRDGKLGLSPDPVRAQELLSQIGVTTNSLEKK